VWLADVAGSGKSAIAHTIAQRCHKKKLLASSFFFDQEDAMDHEDCLAPLRATSLG
jgi:gluconate kinase